MPLVEANSTPNSTQQIQGSLQQSEATEIGHRASEVREISTGLNQAPEDLRRSVIRAVRTSATEVDRRLSQRHALDMPCHLTANGQGEQTARTIDLSERGACVSVVGPMPVGSRGTLRLPGLRAQMRFTVSAIDDRGAHRAFDPTDASTSPIRPLLKTLAA